MQQLSIFILCRNVASVKLFLTKKSSSDVIVLADDFFNAKALYFLS